MAKSPATVTIRITGSYLGIGLEQYKPLDAHFQPNVQVEVELPAAEFKGYEGKGKARAAVVTAAGYFYIQEYLRRKAFAVQAERSGG